MIPINNSDLAWLIVADYNQENGKYHEELREEVIDPKIDDWYWEHYRNEVGDNYRNEVGDNNDSIDYPFHPFHIVTMPPIDLVGSHCFVPNIVGGVVSYCCNVGGGYIRHVGGN